MKMSELVIAAATSEVYVDKLDAWDPQRSEFLCNVLRGHTYLFDCPYSLIDELVTKITLRMSPWGTLYSHLVYKLGLEHVTWENKQNFWMEFALELENQGL